MKKYILFACFGLLTLNNTLIAQCNPQTIISDDFESYTAGSTAGLPTCWKSIAPLGVMIGVRDTGGESNSGAKFLNIYTFFSANATVYIVSPELSTIDGNHFAEFYLRTAYSDVTIEYGTLSDNTDASTFISAGTASPGNNVYTLIITGPIAANPGHKYFAIKFVAPTMHSGIKIDDFSWEQHSSSNVSVNTLSKSEPELMVYPNPSSSFTTLKLNEEGSYTLMDLTGKIMQQNVIDYSGETKIDLSELSNGTYLLTVHTKDGIYSRKVTKH
jgi:hypothetical protein